MLIHHTKKLGGREVTAEDGRGAIALRDAARIVLTLNPMSISEATEIGITDPKLRQSLVRIDTGKANRAPAGSSLWIKLESQSLENGNGTEPPDYVGVASLWERPDLFQGLTSQDVYMFQQGLACNDWRDNPQAKNWVGHLVAKVTGLSASADKARIKAILKSWRNNNVYVVERRRENGRDIPFVVVGRPIDPSEIAPNPHLKSCGVGGAEGTGEDPQ